MAEPSDDAHSLQVGLLFGTTSGIITTLGLVTGLAAGTESRLAVIGGVLTIAVADAMSDALGIHVSEEAEGVHSEREIWTATLTTFASKFLTAATFLVPVLLLELKTAVWASIAWGALVLAVMSYFVARSQRARPLWVILEHLFIAAVVVAITHYLGEWVHYSLLE
ncbi:MAG: VIT1/CCC1 transporter family protein [Verrucomicrobiota bacterium]